MQFESKSFFLPTNFRISHKFSDDFVQDVEGGIGDVDTQSLSGGAKINKIFHEMFPYEMLKITTDETKLRQDIKFIIQNTIGIRFNFTSFFFVFSMNDCFLDANSAVCLLGVNRG